MSELSRLRWRCRRGMRELDQLLCGYLENRYPDAPPEKKRAFAALLDLQDPVLMSYVLGKERPGDPLTALIIDEICSGNTG